MVPLLRERETDLGQYLFSRSRLAERAPARDALPASLFRNYAAERLVDDAR
jgi:hypothetical protein